MPALIQEMFPIQTIHYFLPIDAVTYELKGVNGQQGGGGHFFVTVSTSMFAGWMISGSCYKQLMSRTTNKKVARI